MGSSGAGKTTLLNMLSNRVQKTKSIKYSGEILANNQNIENIAYSTYVGYVTQEDILIDTLTVKECLMFSARLKLNGSYQRINDKVDRLIEELKLDACKNTYIGSHILKGISGGEKKRTCIGIELITDPSVLFLDEPTSGLDSFTASIVISLLLTQARKGRTIISTIHQPSSDIFLMFDKLLLMSDGYILYHGKASSCAKQFARLEFKCPEFSNPADYFIEVLHIIKPHNLNEEEARRVSIFKEAYDDNKKNKNKTKSFEVGTLTSKGSLRKRGFLFQVYMNFIRFGLRVIRNPMLSAVKVFIMTFIAIIVDIFYFQLDKDGISNLRSRNGVLFFIVINLTMSNVQGSVLSFPLMRSIMIKEYNSNMYEISAFFLAKNIVDIFTDIFITVYFGNLVYWIIGLNDNSENVAWFFLIALLIHMSGGSMGFVCGSLFKRAEVAMSFTSISLLPLMYFSGFYRNDTIPDAFRWIENISPLKYGFQALARNEYEGLHATGELDGKPITGMQMLGITMTVRESVMWLTVLMIFFRLLALVALQVAVKRNKS